MDNKAKNSAVTALVFVATIVAVHRAGASNEILIGICSVLEINPLEIAKAFDIDLIRQAMAMVESDVMIAFDITPKFIADLDYLRHLFSSDLSH